MLEDAPIDNFYDLVCSTQYGSCAYCIRYLPKKNMRGISRKEIFRDILESIGHICRAGKHATK